MENDPSYGAVKAAPLDGCGQRARNSNLCLTGCIFALFVQIVVGGGRLLVDLLGLRLGCEQHLSSVANDLIGELVQRLDAASVLAAQRRQVEDPVVHQPRPHAAFHRDLADQLFALLVEDVEEAGQDLEVEGRSQQLPAGLPARTCSSPSCKFHSFPSN